MTLTMLSPETNLGVVSTEELEDNIFSIHGSALSRAHVDAEGRFVLNHETDDNLMMELGYEWHEDGSEVARIKLIYAQEPGDETLQTGNGELLYRFSDTGSATRSLVIGQQESPPEEIFDKEVNTLKAILLQGQ